MRVNLGKIFLGADSVKLALLLSGLVAVIIAITILLAPEAFYAGAGIEVVGDATLVNELKAPAGVLLAAGLLMLAGIFRADLAKVSLVTASVVYLSYGFARLSSMALDGLPDGALIGAASIELFIGIACLLVLPCAQDNYPQHESTRRSQ